MIGKLQQSYQFQSRRRIYYLHLPISLITCLSKCLEKKIKARLSRFTKTKQLISPHQVAFKSNQSCADALLHIDQYVNSALSIAQHVTILSIDFKKGFDRIGSHVILKTLIFILYLIL